MTEEEKIPEMFIAKVWNAAAMRAREESSVFAGLVARDEGTHRRPGRMERMRSRLAGILRGFADGLAHILRNWAYRLDGWDAEGEEDDD